MVFIGYLGAQVSVAVHILQFRSTHQYYRTAKYEPNWTIGDGDTLCPKNPRPINLCQPILNWPRPSWFWLGHSQTWHWQKHNLIYLHHQWSDSLHTLQVDSTGEYFETVEYEPQRTLGLRDILWKPSRLLNFVYVITIIRPTAKPLRSWILELWVFKWTYLGAQEELDVKFMIGGN